MCSDAPFHHETSTQLFLCYELGTEELVLLYVRTMAFKISFGSLLLEFSLPSLNGNAPQLV